MFRLFTTEEFDKDFSKISSQSDKKAQQATINRILLDLIEYQQYVYGLLNKK